MGFYIRKGVRVGPFRFNLSKSGVGVSAGIKGLRVGTGPRGNYVHMGRGGLYYRAVLPPSGTPSSSQPQSQPNEPTSRIVDGLTEIESGSVSKMIDSSSTELLRELNEKRRKWRIWPWLLVPLFLIPQLQNVGASEALVATLMALVLAVTLAAVHWDKMRRTTVLMYDLDLDVVGQYQELHNAFDALIASKRTWHLSAQGATRDRKRNAGAGTLVRRISIRIGKRPPKTVQTNIDVPSVPVGRQVLCFFPERVLVFDTDGVGAVSYDALTNSVRTTRFIEDESAPSDAQVVGHTWKYVNKNGGPDRRFKNNRQLPICLYDEVEFSSPTGLKEVIQVSKTGAAGPLPSTLHSHMLAVAALSQPETALVVSPEGAAQRVE